ncbi:MAG: T9SS type A sorting domain-containing protein [Crocinitomix sp.]|nr:T9SS type A sorting domain-containing protein [Crocinitomix sp.]
MKKIQLLFVALVLCMGALRAQTDIVITEIGYDQAESGTDSTEFIELFNKGLVAIDMVDYSFSAGVAYVFPSIVIEPGAYVVLTIDSLAMIATYGYVGAYQWTAGGLNDDGEGITLRNSVSALVDAAAYNDISPWPLGADGTGKTIVLCDPEANNALGANWALSETNAGITVNGLAVFGSPGEGDFACVDCETTTSSIDETVCGSYTVPSGDETYVATGVYMDTIPNVIGCDSIITIDLTILETSASTLIEAVCGSYTVPSGDETYVISGTYTDTLINEAGCDSIITIELIVNVATESEITETACGTYTVPSGDETYEESGVYMDTIANVAGCDSVMTINVTINSASESEIVAIVCGAYTVPSGDSTYTESGVYTDTLTNELGCDSIITIDLTVNMPTVSEIIENVCDSIYTVPSGDETYFESGVYMDTIPNMAGCDSIITINLNLLEATASEITEVACGSYTVPSGDETYEESGVYIDIISNEFGCDSVITINLTVIMPTASEISETVCDTYTVPSGDETYDATGVYTDTLTNEAGCDSIITINLTVTEVSDAVTILDGFVTADQDGATYQWVDCNDDNAPIDGEIDQDFIPTENGSYAVEVTIDGCTVTSECVDFINIGINENDLFNQVSIYPNPSTGLVNINLGQLTAASVKIISIDGRVVYQTAQVSNELLQVQLDTAPGVYFVQVSQNGSQKQFKLILQ